MFRWPSCYFVKHITGNKYTDFQPNLSIFEGLDTISVEKKEFRNCDMKNVLNDHFLAKNRPILKIFQKSTRIWWNSKKYKMSCLNLISFGAFLANFWQFEDPFWVVIKTVPKSTLIQGLLTPRVSLLRYCSTLLYVFC